MNSKNEDRKENSRQRKLISYAYLAQASKTEGDLLGGITSIFKPIAKIKAGKVFDPQEFCKIVDDLYGLRIHPWTAEDLVPRLEQNGLLIQHKVDSGIDEFLYAEIDEEFADITDKDIDLLTSSFVEFCQPILKQHGLKIDSIELTAGLLEHLTDLNFMSATINPKEASASNNTLKLNKNTNEFDPTSSESLKESFRLNTLCASFVLYTYNTNQRLYDLIVNIVSGAIVAEMVLNFQQPDTNANLSQVTFVLDTPLLMAYMDLTSEKEHLFAKTLADDMISKGAKLAVFEHSIDELTDNLKAVKKQHAEKTSFGETARRLTQRNFISYFDQIRQNPHIMLKKLDMKILSDINSTVSRKHFSSEDEESLYGDLGTYNNENAQKRDASSISQIMRHRNGLVTKQSEFYRCRYIFVTENSRVVRVAKNFMEERKILEVDNFPPAVTCRYISGLLWIFFGGKGQELPKQLLLANCSKALSPKNDIVQRMHKFLEELSPNQADLFDAIMSEERAGQYLMQNSLGDASLLTQENSLEILEKLKSSLNEKHEAEIAKLKTELETEKKEKQDLQDKVSQDFLERIENIMQDSSLAQKRMRILIVVLYFSCLVFTGLYIASPMSNTGTVVFALIGSAFLSLLAFWKIPEFLFEKPTIKYRDYFFQKLARQKELDIESITPHLDWKNNTVSRQR
jgi:hypothetical protein